MIPLRRDARRVLLVEDDAGLCESLRALLSTMGYDVRTAAGSTEALVALNAQRPDVVLTDIYMYGGDGFELINALRNLDAAIPVVAMSGGVIQFDVTDHLGMAQRLGAVATVAKPFRAAHLVEILDRAMAGRLAA
jgi:CheY-like chemotaxis protein